MKTVFSEAGTRSVGVGSIATEPSFTKRVLLIYCFHIQSTLVISTSVISNNRLSRRENLVPVLTKKSKIR